MIVLGWAWFLEAEGGGNIITFGTQGPLLPPPAPFCPREARRPRRVVQGGGRQWPARSRTHAGCLLPTAGGSE